MSRKIISSPIFVGHLQEILNEAQSNSPEAVVNRPEGTKTMKVKIEITQDRSNLPISPHLKRPQRKNYCLFYTYLQNEPKIQCTIRIKKLKKKQKADHPLLFKVIMLFSGTILGLVLTGTTVQIFTAGSASMSPTIKKGDICLINKIYSPHTGDIVAVQSPTDEDKLVLSRIAAVRGDVIVINAKSVYINGKKSGFYTKMKKSSPILPANFSYRDNMPSVKLKEGEVFLISDNYDRAYDSRIFGKIKDSMVFGKVVYIYRP